jgi:hypothetical protein
MNQQVQGGWKFTGINLDFAEFLKMNGGILNQLLHQGGNVQP